MTTWIGLFRGINVGGNNLLPMAELRADMESLKLTNVRTYIQSGNVVFDSSVKTSATLAKKISAMVEERHGFRPHLLMLKRDDLLASIEANPFPKATSDPKGLHFFFLDRSATKPNTEALEAAKAPSETYVLTDRTFYLHAPDGVGRSKLAANAEKYLGVATTARNFRTIEKLVSLSDPGK